MKRLIPITVLALFALGALAAALGQLAGGEDGPRTAPLPALGSQGAYRGSEPPGGIRLPAFTLRDDAGRLVRADDLRRKVTILTFLDSQCTESCPVIASHVARALELLTPSERDKLVAVAISTDPREDTRASVRAFLRRNRALGKLRYLGGGESEAKLRAVWERFSILSSLETGEDTLHSAPVRVYEAGGVWAATLHVGADLTPANLAHDVRVALAKARRS